MNTLEVRIEVRESLFIDKMTQQRELLHKLTQRLIQGIGVHPKVKLVEPHSISREQETAPLAVDGRQAAGRLKE